MLLKERRFLNRWREVKKHMPGYYEPERGRAIRTFFLANRLAAMIN
jgi:hypothetical protein